MSNLLCCLPQGIASFWHLLSWNLVHSFLIGKKLYSLFNYHSNSAVICSLCTKWKSQIRWKHNVALKEMKYLESADFWIYCFDKKKQNASTLHATDAVLILYYILRSESLYWWGTCSAIKWMETITASYHLIAAIAAKLDAPGQIRLT